MPPTTQHDAAPAISGYDGLAERALIRELRQHSQAELDGIDEYERAHRARDPVLDKLRYLRGPQPLVGYDDMTSDEVLAALADADLPTLHAVRGYENKLRARDDVLEGVNLLREQRRPAPEVEEQAPPRRASPNRIREGAVSLGVGGLVVVFVILAVISVLVGVVVVLSVVAPNALP